MRSPALFGAAALLFALISACSTGPRCTREAGRPGACKGPPPAFWATREAAQRLRFGDEVLVLDRVLPEGAIQAPSLTRAGDAVTTRGAVEALFQATPASSVSVVSNWELLSREPGGGWRVWVPDAIVRLENPPISTILSAERVTWPDTCLGLAAPGELCALTPSAGYLLTFRQGDDVVRYHVATAAGEVTYRFEPVAPRATPAVGNASSRTPVAAR